MAEFKNPNSRIWMILAGIFFLTTLILFIVVIILAVENNSDDDDDGIKVCGASTNPNGYSIDLSPPSDPDVFNDLTEDELLKLRDFLEKDPEIAAAELDKAGLDSSYIFTADLFLPNKTDVLQYLDNPNGQKPERRARVLLFRGDLPTPVLEERICGPLPDVTRCELMQLEGRRNPAEMALRPFNNVEFGIIMYYTVGYVEKELGYILRESYQTSFFDCGDVCLGLNPSPLGTSLAGGINNRRLWMTADYSVEFKTLHPLSFGMLLKLGGMNITEWGIEKIFYAGRMYDSIQDLIVGYNASSIPVDRVTKPVFGPQLFSTLMMKGNPMPRKSQRPPRIVEPDGKRYSVKHQKVEYLDWSFNFRMSSFHGPAIYDVKFRGERIAYEVGLQEISVFYAGHSPHPQTTDYFDSFSLLGANSRALVPGGDCPETATFIPTAFMGQGNAKVAKFPKSMCLFETSDGTPLRRKLAYPNFLGAFYQGTLSTALVLRSIISVGNYDYVLDYVFHPTGALETKTLSTGYITGVFWSDVEKEYAMRIHDLLGGSLHHHLFHFKADVDIHGTSNRYETIDFRTEEVNLTADPTQQYDIYKFSRNLKQTELDALYKYDFDAPKYHVIHNDAHRTKFDEIKSYRVQLNGMSKQLLQEGKYNERAAPWARHQMAVTKHKDNEFWSSSTYAMWDSADPVVDFSTFYSDNENITDEDLVVWISMGMHHLPHTEDIPLTTTVGNALTFYLFPYNYFPECPSASLRDGVRVSLKDPQEPEKGVELSYNHDDTSTQCVFPKSDLAKELDEDPDSVLESKNASPIL